MLSGPPGLAIVCLVLILLQALAALPWLQVLTRRSVRQYLGVFGGVAAVAFVGLFYFAYEYSDPAVLGSTGRVYMSVLHLQLTVDAFIVVFWLLPPVRRMVIWAKPSCSLTKKLFVENWSVPVVNSLSTIMRVAEESTTT